MYDQLLLTYSQSMFLWCNQGIYLKKTKQCSFNPEKIYKIVCSEAALTLAGHWSVSEEPDDPRPVKLRSNVSEAWSDSARPSLMSFVDQWLVAN